MGRTKLKPTEIGLRRAFDVSTQTLPNGLKVLLVENPSIPTVSLNASVLVGARYDPESKAGLAIMVSRLLDERPTRGRGGPAAANGGASGRGDARLALLAPLPQANL